MALSLMKYTRLHILILKTKKGKLDAADTINVVGTMQCH